MTRRKTAFLRFLVLVAGSLFLGAGPAHLRAGEPAAGKPALEHSDVVFMYAADSEAYRAYGATFVAWGGAETKEEVKRHRDLGIRCTGSMWCLTAGAQVLHESPELRAAVAVDIEGKPVEVPWLFDHTHQGTKSLFGCTNSPAFRAHNREMVRKTMAGGADGLHVDDHLGVACPAAYFGGGLCDHCMAAFREYLKKHARPEDLAKAGVGELALFDYRDLIRKHAKTREEYRKVQHQIPLMDSFLKFHFEAAAENVRQLGGVAAEAAGHPVLLSANACLPNDAHTHVLPNLTHIVGEVHQEAAAGTSDLGKAIEAYRMASRFGKPLAATASGRDWAHVKEHGCEDLVRLWIALAYAHGQRFMVPHPRKQWCFTDKLGTHWYEAPVDAYAPVYRFIRENAACFDGFEDVSGAGAEGGVAIESPKGTLAVARRSAGGAVVIHVLNTDYDASAKRLRPASNVSVAFPASLSGFKASRARLLSYDAEPAAVPLVASGDKLRLELPRFRIWVLAAVE